MRLSNDPTPFARYTPETTAMPVSRRGWDLGFRVQKSMSLK